MRALRPGLGDGVGGGPRRVAVGAGARPPDRRGQRQPAPAGEAAARRLPVRLSFPLVCARCPRSCCSRSRRRCSAPCRRCGAPRCDATSPPQGGPPRQPRRPMTELIARLHVALLLLIGPGMPRRLRRRWRDDRGRRPPSTPSCSSPPPWWPCSSSPGRRPAAGRQGRPPVQSGDRLGHRQGLGGDGPWRRARPGGGRTGAGDAAGRGVRPRRFQVALVAPTSSPSSSSPVRRREPRRLGRPGAAAGAAARRVTDLAPRRRGHRRRGPGAGPRRLHRPDRRRHRRRPGRGRVARGDCGDGVGATGRADPDRQTTLRDVRAATSTRWRRHR